MASIAEQIVAARKAKGMTQEALAKALNVSRATISNYEGDRRLPDAETLLRLSKVLDYSFEGETARPTEADEPGSPDTPAAPDPEAVPVRETAGPAAEPEKSPARRRIIIALVAAAAVVCAALLLIPGLKAKPQAVPPTGEAVDASQVTKEFFQQPNPDEAGKAFFNLDCVLQTSKTDSIDVWMYTLSMHERHGVAFSIDKVETYTFVSGKVDAKDFSADFLRSAAVATEIEPNGDWQIIGGLPVDEKVSGMGFVIRGTDETGAALSFVFWQPLAAQ